MAGPPSLQNAAPLLPDETLLHIYTSLSQPELLAAAAVSSSWRSAAIRDRNYYRAWTVVFPSAERLPVARSSQYANLDTFVSVVDDALTHRYPLGLTVYIDLEDVFGDHSSPLYDAEAHIEHNKTVFEAVIPPTLLRALPRVVVLKLYPCYHSTPLLWNGLSLPAPVLWNLLLWGGVYHPRRQPPIPPLPAQFLAGSAPRLTDVSLIMTAVSSDSPVFSSVRRLQLAHPLASPDWSHVFRCFPNVRDMEIQCLPQRSDVSSEDAALFARLESLRLGPLNVAELLRALPGDIQIPFIEYTGTPVHSGKAILFLTGPLSARISEHVRDGSVDAEPPMTEPMRFTQLCLEVSSRTATRRVDSDATFSATIKLLNTSHCADAIRHLTIDDRHVRSLIEICKSMPALSAVKIVLVTWHTFAPDALLTEDEVTLYQQHHLRDACSCLGGPFSDWYRAGHPDRESRAAWPALRTVELCATRMHSTVPASSLRGLSDAMTPFPDRLLTLVLSNGLSLADDAGKPALAALFSAIEIPDLEFCASLACVERATSLLAAAAEKKVEARQRMDRMLLLRGADYHVPECDGAKPVTTGDLRNDIYQSADALLG